MNNLIIFDFCALKTYHSIQMCVQIIPSIFVLQRKLMASFLCYFKWQHFSVILNDNILVFFL